MRASAPAPAPHLALITSIAFWLFMLSMVLIPIKSPFNVYDEGLVVFNATRVLGGDLPYRDFWTIYPPGQFYTLAGLFRLFGTSLWISRLYDSFATLLVAVAVWSLARKFTSNAPARLATAVVGLQLASAGLHGSAVIPSMAFGLLAIRSVLEYRSDTRVRWLVLAGTLMGVSACYRWDIGLYMVLCVAVTTLLLHVHSAPWGSPGARRFSEFKAGVALCGPIAVVILACFGAFALAGGGDALWQQVVVYPSTKLREVRWRPLPPLIPAFLAARGTRPPKELLLELLGWLHFYYPLAVYGAAWWCGRSHWHRGRAAADAQDYGRVTIVVLGILLFALTLSRYDDQHVLPTSLIASLVVAMLLSKGAGFTLTRPTRWVAMLLQAGLVLAFVLPSARQLALTLRYTPPWRTHAHLERASGVSLESDQEQAVEFVMSHTRADDAIFVGNRQHDLIYVNDVGFYFLAARRCASHYSELHPGVATSLPVQQEIAEALESAGVRWVVLVDRPAPAEPNASSVSSGVGWLDDRLRSRYEPAARFGAYRILRRIRT